MTKATSDHTTQAKTAGTPAERPPNMPAKSRRRPTSVPKVVTSAPSTRAVAALRRWLAGHRESQSIIDRERRQWLAAREPRHPVLVADRDGRVVGWGSLNQFNPRKAYDFVADFSVYVERAWRGKGVGGALLRALIGRAKQLGYHKMVLSAFPWNAAGMTLYQKYGFRTVGTYKEQGLLDGKWVDTIIMEKIL
ncbi:MAG: N-acetyltransferase [candidate division NC10 bacterium]|nr:N-acetyltransferase [candidate division NC10 bacterium]